MNDEGSPLVPFLIRFLRENDGFLRAARGIRRLLVITGKRKHPITALLAKDDIALLEFMADILERIARDQKDHPPSSIG